MGEERLVKMCMLEKVKNEVWDSYSREKEKFYNKLGLSTTEVGIMRMEEKSVLAEIERRSSDIEKQNIESKIRESKYNRKYKKVMVQSLPKYLKGWGNERDIELIARMRCGNMEEANRYWLGNEDRLCVICKEALGSWEHLVKDCVGVGEEFRKLINNRWEKYEEIAKEEKNVGAVKVLKMLSEIKEIKLGKK